MALEDRPPKNPNASHPKWKLVRLKTVNPKRGIHMRRWSATWRDKHYEIHHDRGWYWVPTSLARYMDAVPARHGVLPGGEGDEDHARAFLIVSTINEAKKLDERERVRDVAKAKTEQPFRVNGTGDLTTGDLGGRRFDETDEDEPVVDAADVVDEGAFDTKIAALMKKVEELVEAKKALGEKKPEDNDKRIASDGDEAVERVDSGEGDGGEEGDEPPVAGDDENPDMNTPAAQRDRVDFRAEGDSPRKSKIKKKQEPPPRTTRALRPGDR